MLLFSTIFDIEETLNADDFIRLVLQWNETSSRIENRVQNINWQGEHTVRFGDEKLCLEFIEYAEKNVITARHGRTYMK